MTLAADLCLGTLDRILERFDLTEVQRDGEAYLPLPGPMPGAGGVCRVWEGEQVDRMVYVGLAFPPAQLDSHMIFAFTAPGSPIPHFTLDSVAAAGTHAFHLDLIPKVDLAANLAHMDAAYGELIETFKAGEELEGLSKADLSPRQLALMSPWMLAKRATEEAFLAMGAHVATYLDHWAKLLENGLPADGLPHADNDPAVRDARMRAALFNADVDPVWKQIEPMVGAEANEIIMAALKGEALAS